MNAELLHLRTQLTHLLWARRWIRWSSAVSTVLTIGVALALALFVVDWLFQFTRPWTYFLLPTWLAGVFFFSKRLAWQLFTNRDSIEEVALFLERQHHVDNDLIAALDFARNQHTTRRATSLTDAVILRAAEISHSLDYSKGLTLETLPARAVSLGIACCVLILVAMANPISWSAFWDRMAFGSTPYPTKTQIDWIAVNGQPSSANATRQRFQIPQGRAVTFEVHCRGQLPTVAKANLIAHSGQAQSEFNLLPVRANPDTYRAELPSIHESCRVVIEAGDATSNQIEITMIPLPQVNLNWRIQPPDYISLSYPIEETPVNSLHVSVFEGSKVQLQVNCPNKGLKSAQFTSAGNVWQLQPADELHRTWELPADTPLDDVRSNLNGEIQVFDEDGLILEKPIACEIRLQPDRPPRVTASAVTRHVLPTAQPTIDYSASDDFGIARIASKLRVIRADGREEDFESLVVSLAPVDQPARSVRDRIRFTLDSYRLGKGDEIRVELIATDWRGGTEGKSSASDPIVFKVTDLSGILHQTGEEDKKAVKQLEEILQRELSIGSEAPATRNDSGKD